MSFARIGPGGPGEKMAWNWIIDNKIKNVNLTEFGKLRRKFTGIRRDEHSNFVRKFFIIQ